MTPLPDLLRSFLSSSKHWNASDVALAKKIQRLLNPSVLLEQVRQGQYYVLQKLRNLLILLGFPRAFWDMKFAA